MRQSTSTFILAVGSLLVTGAAFGADNGLLHAFTPPPGDTSVDYLARIFGAVIDGLKTASSEQAVQAAGNSSKTVIGAMMAVFNSAVLMLGMLFVFYTTVKGTVDTAHEGELLGKKMSEIWVPIRTVIGTSLLLPLTSGFSLLQMSVLWLALQGAGLADAVWNVALDTLAVNGTLGYVSVPDARPLAANILRNQVCMEAMNKQYADSGRATRIQFVANSAFVSTNTGNSNSNSLIDKTAQPSYLDSGYVDQSFAWRTTDNIQNRDVCGAIHFQDSPKSADITSAVRTAILAAHSQAVAAMIKELQPVAVQIVAAQVPPAGALDLAVTHYQSTVQAAAGQSITAAPDGNQTTFIKYAKDAGWVAAGAWWSNITRLNDATQNAINALPVSSTESIDELETSDVLTNYRDFATFTEEYVKNRASAPTQEITKESVKNIRNSDDVWRVLSIPAMAGLDKLTHRIAGANSSPVTQLRSIGNDIISIGLVLKAGMFTAAGILGARTVSWTVGNVFDVLEALKTISGTVEWLSNSLWVIGVMLAYYLPAVPTIWFTMGVIRWLASVAENVLASPVMAAMQIHPDGDDIVGRAGPGYMLLLSMILQPTLLLFAFVLAILMTYVGSALVNEVFLQMVSGTAGNSGVGLIGLVAWTGLYMTMQVLVMHSCFALVSAVPDNVMRHFAAQAGAQNVVKTGDEAYTKLEGGAGGAGAGLARGGMPSDRGSGGGSHHAKSDAGADRPENGFTNADHLGR